MVLSSVFLLFCVCFFFFFSSRRRHTRCSRDWSSDVCSSDLFFALSVAAVIGLIGAGVAARVSAEGHQKFMDGAVVKIRQAIAVGERYLGGVIEKVRWQKRN